MQLWWNEWPHLLVAKSGPVIILLQITHGIDCSSWICINLCLSSSSTFVLSLLFKFRSDASLVSLWSRFRRCSQLSVVGICITLSEVSGLLFLSLISHTFCICLEWFRSLNWESRTVSSTELASLISDCFRGDLSMMIGVLISLTSSFDSIILNTTLFSVSLLLHSNL